MRVIGTIEAGSSATILPITALYEATDVKRLSLLLKQQVSSSGIGPWTAKFAAKEIETLLNK